MSNYQKCHCYMQHTVTVNPEGTKVDLGDLELTAVQCKQSSGSGRLG